MEAAPSFIAPKDSTGIFNAVETADFHCLPL
jgi:hypothetical protein